MQRAVDISVALGTFEMALCRRMGDLTFERRAGNLLVHSYFEPPLRLGGLALWAWEDDTGIVFDEERFDESSAPALVASAPVETPSACSPKPIAMLSVVSTIMGIG